jgi:hypothetical protein
MTSAMSARTWLFLVAIFTLGAGGFCDAQVVPSKIPLIGRDVTEDFGKRPSDAPPPSPDPRDLNGTYQQIEETRYGSPYDPNLVRQCAPQLEIGSRGYPEKIVQTPGRLTFIQEFNHIARRIYIDGTFPAQIEPSYVGYSIGHWDGNSLVVTTRGLKGSKVAGDKSVTSVSEVAERITKQPDGTVKDVATVQARNDKGEAVVIHRNATLVWRPDIKLLEYICEEGAGIDF